MTFVGGLYVICASPECESTDLTTVRESFDAESGIFIGEQQCHVGHGMLYARRPTAEEQADMAKAKKKQKSAPARRERKPVGHDGGKRVAALPSGQRHDRSRRLPQGKRAENRRHEPHLFP